jgi:hypothetical protein
MIRAARSDDSAGVCVSSASSTWVRRCAGSWRDGRFVLEQETNAYAVLPENQWRGYRPPAEPPAPAPGTWGGPVPPLPSAVALAALEADLRGKVQALSTDPGDALARAGVHGVRLVSFPEVHEVRRNLLQP